MKLIIAIIALLIGAKIGFIIQALVSAKKIEEAYNTGFKHGIEKARHRVDRGHDHE